jgi:hypothetical protein
MLQLQNSLALAADFRQNTNLNDNDSHFDGSNVKLAFNTLPQQGAP